VKTPYLFVKFVLAYSTLYELKVIRSLMHLKLCTFVFH